MEQLKPIIEGLKVHRFWIFCGITLIACGVVYYMVSGSMKTEEAAGISVIKSNVSNAQSLRTAGVSVKPAGEEDEGNGGTAHPNDETLSEMENIVKKAAVATREAWQKKFALQSAFQVFDKQTIRENYDFQQYLPAESVAFTEDEEEGMLPETVRVNYRDRIKDELPKLAQLIGSYWKPSFDENQRPPREVIIWNKNNQEYWNSKYNDFSSPWNVAAKESNVPRTLQVLYTTEDLWLLRSILKDVIGKTVFDKGDVYANDLSVIKEIDHILIGKDADLANAEGNGSGGSGGSFGSSSGAMSSSAAMGGGMNGPQGGGNARQNNTDSSNDPIAGRYVDNTGKDIAASEYRSLYANRGVTNRAQMHWKIAKRVKVRIGLQMDTREIQTLLANCTNAAFPIEVRSMRVNQHEPSKLSGTGAGPGGSGGMGMGSGNSGDLFDSDAGPSAAGGNGAGASSRDGPGGGPGGMGGGGDDAAIDEDKDQGYAKPVEIFGYIYIYNKVDDSMFKILKGDQTSP